MLSTLHKLSFWVFLWGFFKDVYELIKLYCISYLLLMQCSRDHLIPISLSVQTQIPVFSPAKGIYPSQASELKNFSNPVTAVFLFGL